MIEILTTAWTAKDRTFRLFGLDTKTTEWCYLAIESDRESLVMPYSEVYEKVQRFDNLWDTEQFFTDMIVNTRSHTVSNFAEIALEILLDIEEDLLDD